jgi:spore maturation protein B
LELVKSILPALVPLLAAVELLRASGALEALTRLLAPAAAWVGIPPETLPLVLVRPLSGSAALAVGAELLAAYGPDSQVGRTVAVMLGSSETTFYTISVYFAAAGVRRTRWAIPAALAADLTGFAAAALAVRLFF